MEFTVESCQGLLNSMQKMEDKIILRSATGDDAFNLKDTVARQERIRNLMNSRFNEGNDAMVI